jgi:hypothetical protein
MQCWRSGLVGVAAMALLSPAGAQERDGRAERMPFGECLALITEVSEEFGRSGMTLERTADVHAARIKAADGYVHVVCRRADQTVTLSRTAG